MDVFMFTMTLQDAIDRQQRQLAHYERVYGPEVMAKVRAQIEARTNVAGRDLEEYLPVSVVNTMVPRGGDIESILIDLGAKRC